MCSSQASATVNCALTRFAGGDCQTELYPDTLRAGLCSKTARCYEVRSPMSSWNVAHKWTPIPWPSLCYAAITQPHCLSLMGAGGLKMSSRTKLALLASMVIIQSAFIKPVDAHRQPPPPSLCYHAQKPSTSAAISPRIAEARVENRRLIVVGDNFSPGSVIYVNGARQLTLNDDLQPLKILVAPDAGATISAGEIVEVKVRNPTGVTSGEFHLFSGRVISLEDSDKEIRLKSGERFLLHLKNKPYEWNAVVEDTGVIRRAGASIRIAGSQGIYQALQPGKTSLSASGELPCHKVTPPCMAPTLSFEVRFVVE